MKFRRGMVFGTLCGLSFALVVIVAVAWVKSFDGDWHVLSFNRGGERYTLKSRWGQFVMWRPPEERSEEKWMGEHAAGMSNEDFDWTAVRGGYVEGLMRRESASWEMWRKNWRVWEIVGNRPYSRIHPETLKARERVWLAAMEDPNRFIPAHMMLLFAEEEARKEYFRRRQVWREASFIRQSSETPEMAVLFMRADAAGTGPDLTVWKTLRREWHDVLDRPRWRLFHGWVVMGALVLPVMWAARPRWRARTWRRWGVNGLALVSALLCAVSVVWWVRSYGVVEYWRFSEHWSPQPRGFTGHFESLRWLGSGKGKLTFAKVIAAPGSLRAGWGYQRDELPDFLGRQSAGAVPAGEKYFKAPGLEFHSMPMQQEWRLWPGWRAVRARYSLWTMTVGWYVPAAVFAVAPMVWGVGAAAWWRRMRRVKALAGKICKVCGYDMRETPQRCSECGAVAEVN